MGSAGSGPSWAATPLTLTFCQQIRMTDIKTIKELQRLTNAGLADCKRALEGASGDFFVAASSMLSEDDVLQLQQSVRVRAMAGESIKDPVTEEEQLLVDRLASHFIAQRTRLLSVGFLFEIARLFHNDNEFQAAIRDAPSQAIQQFVELLDPGGDFAGIQEVVPTENDACTSTVVRMPAPQSEWECDFIVLQHPKKRLFKNSPGRVFAIYKRTKRNDRGVANVEEMGMDSGDVAAISRWVHQDLRFTPQELAGVAFDPNLHQVT